MDASAGLEHEPRGRGRTAVSAAGRVALTARGLDGIVLRSDASISMRPEVPPVPATTPWSAG